MGQGQRRVGEGGSRRAAVLGSPISHSLSPVLHQAAYEELGLAWSYEAVEVPAGGLGVFVAGLDDSWGGLSLTMPLKVEALGVAAFVEPQAKRVGVVNTLIPSGTASARMWVGANTDVHGIVSAFAEAGVKTATRGVVMGAGATAASAMAAMAAMGAREPVAIVRSRATSGPLVRAAAALGLRLRLVDLASGEALEALDEADVIVSTVPADAGALVGERFAGGVGHQGVLLDVIYSPLVTPLALAWAGPTVSGVRMLLHQAGEQVRLMTGAEAPLDAMDAALARVLTYS